MSELAQWEKEELSNFKLKSKEACINSLGNSVSFFVFHQWLEEKFESPEERNQMRDKVFSTWSSQIIAASAPVFAGINDELNKPKNRWQSIIDGGGLSSEDYGAAFTQALKEIKQEFIKAGE